jgi:RNA polymerase sigma-70 factor (ECF subfamily)
MPARITVLLQKLREGDESAADELMPLVYGELRRIARAFMRREQPGHTLQPTALVNEALIKLFEGRQPALADRAHFLALMARVMRQVLVDHARAAHAAKRGGDAVVPWDTNIEVAAGNGTEQIRLLELHDALDALALENPSLARAIELHYFGGLTAEELATAVGRSAHAVRHDLRFARAWLRRRLSQTSR